MLHQPTLITFTVPAHEDTNERESTSQSAPREDTRLLRSPEASTSNYGNEARLPPSPVSLDGHVGLEPQGSSSSPAIYIGTHPQAVSEASSSSYAGKSGPPSDTDLPTFDHDEANVTEESTNYRSDSVSLSSATSSEVDRDSIDMLVRTPSPTSNYLLDEDVAMPPASPSVADTDYDTEGEVVQSSDPMEADYMFPGSFVDAAHRLRSSSPPQQTGLSSVETPISRSITQSRDTEDVEDMLHRPILAPIPDDVPHRRSLPPNADDHPSGSHNTSRRRVTCEEVADESENTGPSAPEWLPNDFSPHLTNHIHQSPEKAMENNAALGEEHELPPMEPGDAARSTYIHTYDRIAHSNRPDA